MLGSNRDKKGNNHENQLYALREKDIRLRNLSNEEKGGSQSQNLDGTALALAYRLVPRLEGLSGLSG
jgi:hypothetical protein